MRNRALLLAGHLLALPAAGQTAVLLDGVADGAEGHYDAYTFTAKAGARYMITLTSASFDAVVRVGPADGGDCRPCVSDGDSGGDTDAMLPYEAPADGMQAVRVTSLDPGRSGAYRLLVETEGNGLSLEDVPPRRVAPPGAAGVVGTVRDSLPPLIRPGETRPGALAPSDAVDGDGAYMDTWRFAGEPGATYVITLRSGSFDAYLRAGVFSSPACSPGCAANDNGGGGTDARLSVRTVQGWEYSIFVRSAAPGQAGAYTLSLERR